MNYTYKEESSNIEINAWYMKYSSKIWNMNIKEQYVGLLMSIAYNTQNFDLNGSVLPSVVYVL